MPSDKYNSITAKAMGLIFSLFDVTSAGHMPFGIPQYIQRIVYGLSVPSFVSRSSLLTTKCVNLVVARDGFPL